MKNIDKKQCSIKSCLELSSDHSPVIVELKAEIKYNDIPLKLHTNKTNWTLFKEICTTHINLNIPLKSSEDIENATHDLTLIIQKASWNSTPESTGQTSKVKLNNNTSQLLKEKRLLRKKWQRTRHPSDKTLYNKAVKKLKKSLATQNNESFDQYLSNLSPRDNTKYSLWKATRSLDNQTIRIPPIKKTDLAHDLANTHHNKEKTTWFKAN